MSLFNRKSTYARASITVMLIVAMLCVHWVGLVHRVIHADGMDSVGLISHDVKHQDVAVTFTNALIDGHADSEAEEHSCLLFDAAALGTTVHSTPFLLVPLPGAQVLALWIAFASWQPPFTCHFSSRAPPGV